MTTPRIFLSHSHIDNDFAKKLTKDLRDAFGETDTAVWIDEYGGLHGGVQWMDKVVGEITARGIFLVVLSPSALDSHWVQFEMGIALHQHVEYGKKLLPIIIEACAIPNGWKIIQYVDCTGYAVTYDQKLQEILVILKKWTEEDPEPHTQHVSRREGREALLVQDANTAAGRMHWEIVRDKTDLLIEHFPRAMTADLWRLRGHALLELNNPTDALTALDHALNPLLGAQDAYPTNAPVLRLRGLALKQLGRINEANHTLKQARKAARIDDIAFILSIFKEQYALLETAERWLEAKQVCTDALLMTPDDTTWQGNYLKATIAPLTTQFITAMQEQDYDAALRICQEALGVDKSNAEWRHRQTATQEAVATKEREDNDRRQHEIDRILPRRLATFKPPLHAPFFLREDGSTKYIQPPLVDIPAGLCKMGSQPQANGQVLGSEYPVELVLSAYQIGRYPVTVAEYACAVRAKRVDRPQTHGEVTWEMQLTRMEHPVVNISWQDAMQYIAWFREVTGDYAWRLPKEAEWEKAARWDEREKHARIYPWGDTWDATKTNTSESGPGTTTPVGAYAELGDASPYGCHDMAGNVWEWTSSLWRDDSYADDDLHEDDKDTADNRVLRGGSWNIGYMRARAACRNNYLPGGYNSYTGFRIARTLPS